MASVANADESQGKPLAGITAWPERIRSYVKDLRGEMTKVTWPSWKQVRATTAVVLVTVFAFAAYFAVVDIAMAGLISRLFKVLTG
jgi:preprotein translocase subunit SecE